MIFSILPNLLECVGANPTNLLVFPILPICHSVGSKIIECDNQSETHNGCLIQGECVKVIHYVAKYITQNPFPLIFLKPWNDRIIEQHPIHAISIIIFVVHSNVNAYNHCWVQFFKSVPKSCHMSPFYVFLT